MAVRGGDAWMQVDEIQAELLPPMPDAYASLANKLHQMVIHEDEPHAKKRRMEVIDLTTDDDHDTNHRPQTHTENADENTESMEEEEEEEQASKGSRPPLRLVRRVSTLVELCIGAPHPSLKPTNLAYSYRGGDGCRVWWCGGVCVVVCRVRGMGYVCHKYGLLG
jgi:hypothetical protein